MKKLIENIQLLLLTNKSTERDSYQIIFDQLKESDFTFDENYKKLRNNFKTLRVYLNESSSRINDKKIDENELEKLTCFYEKTFDTFEYESINEIIFSSLVECKELFPPVQDKLISNIKNYFDSNHYQHVSFSSLSFYLFYIYKIKYFGKKKDFEKKYSVQNYLYDEKIKKPKNSNTDDQNEVFVLEYLRKYLFHDDYNLKVRTFKLCYILDITLSIEKTLEFIYQIIDSNEKRNLVIITGVTGAGKSTIINNLCGTKYKKKYNSLIPEKGYRNFLKVSNEFNPFSETMFCETVKYTDPTDPKQTLNFYDTPGFNDISSSTNKSLIASLGFPLLVKKAESIKSIVIVIKYDLFNISGDERGRRFQLLIQNLMKIFKNFEENNSNFLFAISRPDTALDKHDLLDSLEMNLQGFEDRLEGSKKELDEKLNKRNDYEDKIELYESFIGDLKKLEEENSNHFLHTKYRNIKSYFKGNESKNETKSTEELNEIKIHLAKELNEAKENPKRIRDKLDIAMVRFSEFNDQIKECNNFIDGFEEESKMIKLIKEAIKKNNVFFLPCCKAECDGKNELLHRLKTIGDQDNIDKNLFNFDQEQETFKSVKLWASELFKHANQNMISLRNNFRKIKEKDIEIESNKILIYEYINDLVRLMRPGKVGKLILVTKE